MSNTAIRQLEPKSIWNHFADLNAVPRPSKKEERVIAFMKDFGERLNLETLVDPVGNVIIRKPATAGLEDRPWVTLQSHLDMVHQKNAGTDFDFDRQGIAMKVDGDWVKAEGTTLGADNGLGVATIMAVLSSTDLPHPPIEALFTIDEETGMTGAMGLQPDLLKGEILLNLDTEEDDEIGIGCAGGIDVTASGSYSSQEVPEQYKTFTLTISGLQGGHSGMDIHRGLGNANKLMARLLYRVQEEFDFILAVLEGGSLRNAIPREAFAKAAVPKKQWDALEHLLEREIEAIGNEYHSLEPHLKIQLQTADEHLSSGMDAGSQKALIRSLKAAWNGVYRKSPDFEDLVETSNNVARVQVKQGEIYVECLTRSSVESSKRDLANTLKATFELAGLAVSFSGAYPGWEPKRDSAIVQAIVQKYRELHGEEPHVAACHAGLECGILGQHYPEMDMVSFGPTIKGAHSPDERVSISSVQKYWKLVKALLADIPAKA
ncbi:aminoacyl-histidine dipeptidase [Croceiramulus getboli]|nr:aminoacyl-histidine dipeptidase [Flavobacteriaceae bacterium YJPT1-3]